MKKYILGIVLVFLMVSCEPSSQTKDKKIRSVSCLIVSESQIIPQIEARGLSHPYKTSRLSFRISGMVESIAVKKGQAVKEKEILATLEKTDFQLQLEKAQQLLKFTESKLERIKAKERPETFLIAEAKIKLLENVHQNKLKTYESQIRLNQSKIVSDIDIDRLKTEAQIALEELEIAKQELVILGKGSRIEDIQLAIEEVALAKLEAKIQQQNVNYVELRAPFRGIVTSIDIEQGEVFNVSLNPISLAMVLDDLYNIKLKVSIPEIEIVKVKTGQNVVVFFDSLPNQEFQGKLSYIPNKADQVSKTFLTEITVANPDLAIKVGMFAYARILIGEKKQTVLLPPQLLLHDHLGTYVFKLESSPQEQLAKVIRQNVKTGLLIGNKIQITEGISPGDWIIDEGNHYIHHQSEVFVVNQIKQNVD